MAKAPDDPKRGWIDYHAMKWNSVDEKALQDGAVVGSKIPDGALTIDKLTPELRELIESLQTRISTLEARTYPASMDGVEVHTFSSIIENAQETEEGEVDGSEEG